MIDDGILAEIQKWRVAFEARGNRQMALIDLICSTVSVDSVEGEEHLSSHLAT